MSIIFGLSGPHLTTVERRWLRSPNAAGVILFGRNYQDRQQLAALCGDIHALAPKVFISVDWEGGRVQRFREGFTPLPCAPSVKPTPSTRSAATGWPTPWALSSPANCPAWI